MYKIYGTMIGEFIGLWGQDIEQLDNALERFRKKGK